MRKLRCLATRVAALDRDIRTAIGADEGLARRAEVLRSIPGVGPATVASLIATMPELGSLDRRAVAAPLGTAPWANHSGKHQGRRHVRGGRAAPRRAIHMAALAAIRFNPPQRDFYRRLREAGKEHNVALVAVMRKLVILANVLLQQGRNRHRRRSARKRSNAPANLAS
ncbi:MAG: IS110 family transposase [Acidobacteria bacterium]|nr:IS110 family transposase [Acidobacteriota bacterium]